MELFRVRGQCIALVIMIELTKVPETSSLYVKYHYYYYHRHHYHHHHHHLGSRNSQCFHQDRKQKHRKTMT